MREKFRILLGIEAGETSIASMLLTQSVFLGIFIGAFDISAYSLLLSTFDEKLMAYGYIASGIAGIILTSFFLRFRKRIQINKLAFINLAIVSIITLFLWAVLKFHPEKWMVVLVFIMAGPLNILTLFGFWGITSKKRNFAGLADSGILTGIALISFTIPLLMSLKFMAYNILLIGAVSAMIATFIQRAVTIYMRPDVSAPGAEKLNTSSFLSSVQKNGFYRVLALYATFSVLVAFVIQYSFMTITRNQFPVAESMAGFLGLFTGIMMLFTEFLKRIVFPQFIRMLGIRGCLIISPAVIILITLLAIVVGFSIGYSRSSYGYAVFFILLSLNRFVSKSIKDSFEIPSFKGIYESLENSIRTEIKNGITYSVNESGVLLSGIILSVFGFLSFIKIIHFSLLLFFLVLVWLFLAIKLYKEYRKSLIKSIETSTETFSKDEEDDLSNNLKNRFAGQLFFRTNYFNLLIGDYEVLNNIKNEWYHKELIDFALSKNDLNLVRVLKTVSMNADLNGRIRRQSTEAIEILQNIPASFSLPKSHDFIAGTATKNFSETRIPQTSEILSLLRSNSIESKRQAIFLIGKFRLTDLLYVVCECLNTRGLASDAFKVLQSFGAYAENDLVRYYLIMSGNTRLSKTILQLFGKICTKGKSGFLYSRLWTNSRQLKEVVIKGLIDCKFVPAKVEKQRLDQLISEITGVVSWNLSCKMVLEKSDDKLLVSIIDRETERWISFLFNIILVTYGAATVEIIRKIWENKIIGNGSYIHEIAGIVFSDPVKLHLLALLEAGPDYVKVKKLSRYFPVEVVGRDKLLEEILNRDYNLIGLWAKANVLRTIVKIDTPDMAESVIALLFSPEQILQEEAANLIKHTGNEIYFSAGDRLPETIKKRIEMILNGSLDSRDLVFEKVRFLSKCFTEIDEDDLIQLASELIFVKEFSDENVNSTEGYIVWETDINGSGEVQIIYNGIAGSGSRLQYIKNQSYYFLSFSSIEEFHFQFPDESLPVLNYIDKHDNNW